MKEQVDSLISGLSDLSVRLGDMVEIESDHTKAKASLETTNKMLATAKADLAAAAGTAGRRAFVTDANSTTFASIVAGSGTNGVPVYDDGTNWRIG